MAPAARPLLEPRSPRHRLRICHGDVCPRCASRDTRPWGGGFAGRRRFRCLACRRTFSTFTGTPLQYLKRIDRWPRFTRSFDDRDSIRHSADRLAVHPSTAHRWRHRLLADWVRRDDNVVSGRVYMGRAWFAHSEKGRAPDGRPPRRRGYPYPHRIPVDLRVQAAFAWERDDSTLAEPSPPGVVDELFPLLALFPRFRAVDVLLGGPLPIRGLEAGAGPMGVRVVSQWDDPLRGGPAIQMGHRMRRWFRPLHGVATRYLGNYLRWFRSDLAEGHPTLDRPSPRLLRWLAGLDGYRQPERRRSGADGSRQGLQGRPPPRNNSREQNLRNPGHEVGGG